MTAEELMSRYEKVREEEKINGELCLITNPKAKTGDNSKAGGILLVGMNPSGKGQGLLKTIKIAMTTFGFLNIL